MEAGEYEKAKILYVLNAFAVMTFDFYSVYFR
jgi:hypothetical protein